MARRWIYRVEARFSIFCRMAGCCPKARPVGGAYFLGAPNLNMGIFQAPLPIVDALERSMFRLPAPRRIFQLFFVSQWETSLELQRRYKHWTLACLFSMVCLGNFGAFQEYFGVFRGDKSEIFGFPSVSWTLRNADVTFPRGPGINGTLNTGEEEKYRSNSNRWCKAKGRERRRERPKWWMTFHGPGKLETRSCSLSLGAKKSGKSGISRILGCPGRPGMMLPSFQRIGNPGESRNPSRADPRDQPFLNA